MKEESNSNILNGILNIINISESQIQKKNKTSYYKFFISHKPLKNLKSTSLNNIYTQKYNTNSKIPQNLYLKDLENSKYNYKKYFLKNKSNKILSQNNSINKYQTINDFVIKKKSSLPYLYRNLHKNVSIKHLNEHRKKMNSTDFDKFPFNNKNDISFFSENLKNNFINKNDSKENKDYKLVNNKLKLIYNKTKYNKDNKGKIKNNKNEKNVDFGYSINKIDLGSFLKKNNSDIFFKANIKLFNNDNSEKLLSDRTIKKEKEIKNIKNNNFLNKKNDLEMKNKNRNKYNSKTLTNIINNKEQVKNLIKNKIKIKNEEKVTKISKINIINDKNKENSITKKDDNENNIIKNIINNSKNNLSLDEKEILSYNKECESERKEENEIENDLIFNEEQEKIFNTNQKNFFKFRKDIKEDPDLEGEEDLD